MGVEALKLEVGEVRKLNDGLLSVKWFPHIVRQLDSTFNDSFLTSVVIQFFLPSFSTTRKLDSTY